MTPTISPELRSLIPPLAPDELAQLEANLLADGVRDPLVVWQEEGLLLDGHHRLSICERHGLPYAVDEVRLPDMDAAKTWMIAHQLGRRNLSPDQMAYYRGQQYNLMKRQGKRTDITSPQGEEKLQKTSHVLASQHHVGRATIERDGAYADAIETLARVCGPAVRQLILGTNTLTRRDVQTLAGLALADPETAAVIREAVQQPDATTTLQTMARAARCGICHRLLSAPASISRGIGPVCAGHDARASGGGGGCGVPPRRAEARSAPAPVATPLSLPALCTALLDKGYVAVRLTDDQTAILRAITAAGEVGLTAPACSVVLGGTHPLANTPLKTLKASPENWRNFWRQAVSHLTIRYCCPTYFHAIQLQMLRWILQVPGPLMTAYARHNLRHLGVGQQYPIL